MGSFSNSDSVRMGQLMFHAIAGIGSSSSVPRARVAAIPYATLGVRLGSSDESLFVLATQTGDDLVWRGGPQLAITTRNGRIVRTAGFVHNLSGFQTDVSAGSSAGGNSGSKTYLYDFYDQSRYGIAVNCAVQNLGPERITIIGVSIDATHVAEDCVAPQLGWTFRNEFWRDKAGFVWKSRQHVVPELDAFTLEVLRRAK
ncbi:MAG TPA: YjbF family lipoprotein [Rhizomicrobium sp.]|nr:YjbF family lipoprotein [Rhizomicrobium sp.]